MGFSLAFTHTYILSVQILSIPKMSGSSYMKEDLGVSGFKQSYCMISLPFMLYFCFNYDSRGTLQKETKVSYLEKKSVLHLKQRTC